MNTKAHSHLCECINETTWRVSWLRGRVRSSSFYTDREAARRWCTHYGVVFPEPAQHKQPKSVRALVRRLGV